MKTWGRTGLACRRWTWHLTRAGSQSTWRAPVSRLCWASMPVSRTSTTASLIRRIYGMDHLAFQQGDIHQQSPGHLGQFDVVLMLGLLYHLENPVGALRVCRSLCSKLCIIETQIVPGMTGYVDYGSYQYVRPLKGSFGIIDETEETHGPEASITGVCLVPSLDALMWLLRKVGFSSVAVLEPPEDAYEQLRYHKRVMVAARV